MRAKEGEEGVGGEGKMNSIIGRALGTLELQRKCPVPNGYIFSLAKF
jgi:hypothetical protein